MMAVDTNSKKADRYTGQYSFIRNEKAHSGGNEKNATSAYGASTYVEMRWHFCMPKMLVDIFQGQAYSISVTSYSIFSILYINIFRKEEVTCY